MRDLFPAPQPPEKPDRLVGPSPPLTERHAACPELLRVLAANTDADDDTSARRPVQVGDLLGNDGRGVQR